MQEPPPDPGEHPRTGPEGRARQHRSYSAEDVRQGEIILKTRRRRWIFFGGLVACVILAIVATILLP
jgi:hypothetical protein